MDSGGRSQRLWSDLGGIKGRNTIVEGPVAPDIATSSVGMDWTELNRGMDGDPVLDKTSSSERARHRRLG